jgi:hypothetical protein
MSTDPFLVELDGMIEATEEFIADDGLRADDERVHDLSALLRTRALYVSTFAPEDGGRPDPAGRSAADERVHAPS